MNREISAAKECPPSLTLIPSMLWKSLLPFAEKEIPSRS